MRLFVGLDVSLAKTAICVVSEHGKIVNEAQVASEPEVLVRWAREQKGTIAAIGLEAGPLSQWLHRGLSGAGLDVVLMETRQVKGALKAMPIKTDRRDAEGIARLLHLGWFRPVHCKSVSAQEVRAVLGARKALQQGMIALEMSLRGQPVQNSACDIADACDRQNQPWRIVGKQKPDHKRLGLSGQNRCCKQGGKKKAGVDRKISHHVRSATSCRPVRVQLVNHQRMVMGGVTPQMRVIGGQVRMVMRHLDRVLRGPKP